MANSGALYFQPDGSVVLTPGAYARFLWLVGHYGKRLTPPLVATNNVPGVVAGTGTNIGNWVFTAQRADDFQKLTFIANNPSFK